MGCPGLNLGAYVYVYTYFSLVSAAQLVTHGRVVEVGIGLPDQLKSGSSLAMEDSHVSS